MVAREWYLPGRSTDNWLLRDSRLSLEVVLLLTCGMAALILGALLFPIRAGILPFSEGGLFGLLLVLPALQTITLGRTPFGDVPRTWLLVFAGLAVAAVGIVTAFIPGALYPLPGILAVTCLGGGGIALLLQLLISKNGARNWMGRGGIFVHLTVACALVYALSIAVGGFLCSPRLLTTYPMAVLALVLGLALLYLAWTLQRIGASRPSPPAPAQSSRGRKYGMPAAADAPTDRLVLMVLGLFILLLGILLVPVGLGLLPFAGSAMIGLMTVIFAVQMVAVGSTPIGAFRRTHLVVVLGFVFAAAGIVSCIVPGILVTPLTILIGLLNVVGGIATVAGLAAAVLRAPRPAQPPPPLQVKILLATLAMNILSIIFGSLMLLPGVVPALPVGVVLTATGCVLLYLVYLLLQNAK